MFQSNRHLLTRFAPALLVLALASYSSARAGTPPPSPAAASRRTPVVQLVEKVRDAVVNIQSERTVLGGSSEYPRVAAAQHRVNGMGTGVIIDPRGYIVTNHHVVEEVNVIRVVLSDKSSYSARVVGRNPKEDIALLKIDAARLLPTVPLGTSSDLQVGETVIAIGNAFGYQHTVTCGIVSALHRDVNLNKEISYKALIQIDTSINPGNSGGPLFNINGELVGINVAIRAGAQGISFTIPVDSMLRVVGNLLKDIRKRGGITSGMLCRDNVDATQTTLVRTAVVDRIDPTGPAAKAGIAVGDVVVKVGPRQVCCNMEFEAALVDRAAGERVAVVCRRNGSDKTIEVALQSTKREPVPTDLAWRKLGMRLSTVKTDLVSRANQQLHGGLTVVEVSPEGAAGKAGIQPGDILVGLHQWETVNLDNVAFVLTNPDLAKFNPLRFYIVRAGQVHRGWLQQVD